MFKIASLVLLFAVASQAIPFDFGTQTSSGYVNVRSNAFMFWWFFHASKLTPTKFVKHANSENYPIVIWLQGGPGGSSTGIGNFDLIGPLDRNFHMRNTSWIQHANLLFIDNPVGTGFSYVTSNDAFATNNDVIASDLVTVVKHFFNANPIFHNSPIYIFSESYGGKMAVSFAIHLSRAVQKKEIKCNLKGLVLGDPWISPIDSVTTWPQYLKSFSLIDEQEFEDLNHKMKHMEVLLKRNEFDNATRYWSLLESIIRQKTFNVDFYNVMNHDIQDHDELAKYANAVPESELFLYKLGEFYDDVLDQLMSIKVRSFLSIPNDVIWDQQRGDVFKNLLGDFMRPVLDEVNYILNNLPIKVVVYNGQWDLIVNILGTTNWVNKLQYPGADQFKTSQKNALKKDKKILGFYKTHGKFSFYWILSSGHMVPRDASDASFKMFQNILQFK